MSEQLVTDAYDARRNQEISWLTQPAQAPAAGAGDGSDGSGGAPAPAQPTSSVGKRGIVGEITEPWQQAGKQVADALVPPPGSQAGVPRRLWELAKGMGHALV